MSGGGIASLTKVPTGSDTTSFIITPDRPPLKKKKVAMPKIPPILYQLIF